MESESTTKKSDYDPNWLIGTSAEQLLKNDSINIKNFSNPVFKKLSKINGKINDMSVDDLVASLNELNLDPRFI